MKLHLFIVKLKLKYKEADTREAVFPGNIFLQFSAVFRKIIVKVWGNRGNKGRRKMKAPRCVANILTKFEL